MNKQQMKDIITHANMASVKPSGDQNKIDNDVAEFLAKGGKIQQIEEGVCNEDMRLNMNFQENVDRQRTQMGKMFNPKDKK